MHLINVALLASAGMLLTMGPTVGSTARLERSLALGMTAAVWWEIAEYAAFISGSSERRTAYQDTLSDLALGCIGAVLAAALLDRLTSRGRLEHIVPVTAASSFRASTIEHVTHELSTCCQRCRR